nr:RagB/SusD family nutrient uptake outer membrane protein [Bacteroides intestinalis]
MKLNVIILSLFTTIGLFSSCVDVLDIAPDGSLTMEEIVADPNKVGALLNSCYNNVPLKGYTSHHFETLLVAASDDGWSSDDGQNTRIAKIYNGVGNASSHPVRDMSGESSSNNGAYWAKSWNQIYLCNQFLEIIDNAAVNSEQERERYRAEARVLRAFFYSELVRWFGKIPVLETTVAFDADFSGLKRLPVHEVVEFIIKDCDAGIACAELPWRVTTKSEAMRTTKALAWAIKSRMSLVAASPLFNEGNDYWEEAYQINAAALKALTENGYELFTTCTDINTYGDGKGAAFRQIVASAADYAVTPRDKETIWQHAKTGTMGSIQHHIWHIGYIGCGMDNTFKCATCPTQELVDAFETLDGQPVLNLNKPYLDERHLQPNYNINNTLYDPNNPYVNRDPRLHETALCNGDQIVWDNGKIWNVDIYEGGRHHISLDPSDRTRSRTGYYHCKTVVPKMSATNQGSLIPWKFFRLAEIYLNLAETAAESGHMAEAKAAADVVRDRVGMPALPVGLNKDELLLRIKNERRVELAWEEIRYFDLRRWQKTDGDLRETCTWLTGMKITPKEDGTFAYERYNIWTKERGGAQNRDLLLPLPQDEVNRMEAVTGDKWQNPGW